MTSTSEDRKDASTLPANRHAPSAYESQKLQLEKLLKDPSKLVSVPSGPSEKTIRPPREMMKNVQGSSAGAGSGEFHVYKQSRRREYERIKIMEEQTEKEASIRAFEEKRAQQQEQADAKTAKNRAKRQKRKERTKGQKSEAGFRMEPVALDSLNPVTKKRKLDNQGLQLVYRRPGDQESGDESDHMPDGPPLASIERPAVVAEERTMLIVDDS